MEQEDTIAAISTAYGHGGIGIIRISGGRAFEIARRIFRGREPFEKLATHSINYGKIINPETSELLDEVLVSKMKGPNTFTREDVVEINCHGGPVVQKRVLELVVNEGARLAEPGEFTKRAFMNGRIDLSQAEAVIDLINSRTAESSRAALDQLEGRLSRRMREIREILTDLIAHIEVTVDYPEHDIEEITGRQVYAKTLEVRDMLRKVSSGFERGRILREGLNAVIVGRPNVGKSSLLNEIAGKDRAIVTDIPGTTRDIIEEYVNIRGIPVRMLDTAGIRRTEDAVERIGVERAEREIEKADLVIMLIDVNEGVVKEDMDILEKIRDKKTIVLLNKTDIADPDIELPPELSNMAVIRTSVRDGTGISELEDLISGMFFKGDVGANDEILLTNIRHKNLIDNALRNLDNAVAAYEGNMPLDCITIDLREAALNIGRITGESINEDILHQIFSRFCVGK